MLCPGCGFDNAEGMKFCVKCATPLRPRCPRCGFENPSEAVFCDQCAAPLTSESPPAVLHSSTAHSHSPLSYPPSHRAEHILAEQAALEAQTVPDGERKTITDLFADIKGSMELLENLDPEEARRIIDPALQRMIDAVHRYEGYVAQSLGDGIFALFGAPIAHEDHAQRALYAALRMQEEMRRYAETLRLEHGINLQIRVGLNTGEVVVRSMVWVSMSTFSTSFAI